MKPSFPHSSVGVGAPLGYALEEPLYGGCDAWTPLVWNGHRLFPIRGDHTALGPSCPRATWNVCMIMQEN